MQSSPLPAARGRPGSPVLLALILAVVAVLSVSSASLAAAQRKSSLPNIVVIYMDDFSPHAPDLWSDPARTPTLARFVQEGTWLSAGIGSTPRCCPGRANVLTGQWSHHNGVTENDMGPYKPKTSFAPKLRHQGYYTMYAGKFLNRMPVYTRKPGGVLPYARGWDQFDVIWSNHGKFYDYPLWTRQGVEKHKHKRRDHSTQVVTEHMRQHIRKAPADQPIFAMLALFDGHAPNLPMPRFKGDPRCANEPAWTSPSFNEADVSDKPQYIQRLAPLTTDGYDLVTRCEEILSVDWATHVIFKALKRTGRMTNTMFIFTADNGWLMGEHRVEDKKPPYSTPIPTYFLWPARWGSEPRVIDEPVSNVDLAPTFCALAGCEMRKADGLSLLPLLDGEVDALDRRYVYEESLHDKMTSPAWYGLRTTRAFDPERRWVYDEYSTGERELYDLVTDPWQLQNLANDPAYAGIVDELATMLHTEVIEPDHVTFIS